MDAQIVVDTTFRCGKCAANFPWSTEIVGRLARCKCGNVLKVPAQPIEGLAAVQSAAAEPPASPPIETSRLRAAAPRGDAGDYPSFLRMPIEDRAADQLDAETEAVLAETGKFGEDPEAHQKPDPRRDLHVPLALLAIGVVLTFIGFNTGGTIGAIMAAVATIVSLIISTVLFVGGGLAAAHFGGIYLGTLGPALLKFAAVSIFPAALADLITKLLGGDMAVACLGNGVGIVTCWALVGYLFRLDGPKTITVVVAIAVVKFLLGFILFAILGLFIVSIGPSFDSSNIDTDQSVISSIEDDSTGNGETDE